MWEEEEATRADTNLISTTGDRLPRTQAAGCPVTFGCWKLYSFCFLVAVPIAGPNVYTYIRYIRIYGIYVERGQRGVYPQHCLVGPDS